MIGGTGGIQPLPIDVTFGRMPGATESRKSWSVCRGATVAWIRLRQDGGDRLECEENQAIIVLYRASG